MSEDEDDEEDSRVELSAQLTESRKTMRAFGDLLKTPGWNMLREIAEEQVRKRIDNVILSPLKMDAITEQEFVKGEVSGLRLLLELPKIQHESAKAVVESLDVRKDSK